MEELRPGSELGQAAPKNPFKSLRRVVREFDVSDLTHGEMTVSITREGDLLTIAPVGALEHVCCDRFNERIDEALLSDASQILVDLSGVNTIDSWGVGALMRANGLSKRDRHRIVFDGARGPVRSFLRLTGIEPLDGTV